MTKLEKLKDFMKAENWHKAISLAASFPSLGKEKDAIKSADMAIKHRDFCLQINKDPDALIIAGINALKTRYL